MQFNRLQSHMPCSAAAERKEQNRLHRSRADDGFIWLGMSVKKFRAH